ncbi:MAG TPA: hypothetical protein VFM04_04305 [Candidatus Methylomirabilis sp.]|nr:hypothetical protein [Candidatus Methylomirabilis sp.]
MPCQWSRRALPVLLLLAATARVAAAPQVSISIATPQEGATITAPSVSFTIDAKGFKIDCGLAGKASQDGVGHWHVILDDRLVDMACGPGYLVSLRNVKPGPHTLVAVLAQNNHTEIRESAAKVTFTFRPEEVLPHLTDFNAGKPRLLISFPKNGATVTGQTFPLLMNVQNFRLSCETFGKPPVANTGHWHVDLDRTTQRMATMLSMGCTNAFDVPLKGIPTGPHTFIVVLVDNLHYPITPLVAARVTVRVR